MRARVEKLRSQKHELMDILQFIYDTGVAEAGGLSLGQLLTKYEEDDDVLEALQDTSDTDQSERVRTTEGGVPGEELAPLSVGSPKFQDHSSGSVNLACGTGASGFIGKLSEISWLGRARDHILQNDTRNSEPRGSRDLGWLAAADLSYHVDEANLLAVDEELVNEYQWPSMAATMAGAYFDTLYPTFPFVNKGQFLQELSQSYHLQEQLPIRARRRWLAKANMIFCLGSKWFLQGNANSRVGQDDHLMYYARARKLGLDHRIVLDHPTVEQVDALGLLALYLIMNHHVTRAWTAIGSAIRHAVALAMHLVVRPAQGQPHSNSFQPSTWYALYNLETFVVEITGRPTSMIADPEMTVSPEGILDDPGPEPTNILQGVRPDPEHISRSLDQRDSVQSLSIYFLRRVSVSRISRRISATLYAADLDMNWGEFQGRVHSFEIEIEELANSVAKPQHNLDGAWLLGNRHNLELVMSIRSLQMMLYRPFLCDWHEKIRHESLQSQDFNQSKARAAIAAARSTLALVFSVDDLQTLPLVFPCWSTLHYICQAGAILILELAMHAIHLELEADEMVSTVHKLLTYLQAMSTSSSSASKAWSIFTSLLNEIESRLAPSVCPGLGWTPSRDDHTQNSESGRIRSIGPWSHDPCEAGESARASLVALVATYIDPALELDHACF